MYDISTKIPFRVSSRTARLIGRENVASPKGALIELVKNCYDADSAVAIVFIDNKYSVLKDFVSIDDYNYLIKNGVSEDLLNDVYIRDLEGYSLREKIPQDIELRIKNELSKLAAIYIIDAGEGMTYDIITNNWMVIGTDNKNLSYISQKGRVKSGAKGIGRFALDKLGSVCEMTTIFSKEENIHVLSEEDSKCDGYCWKVNWDDFDTKSQTIDNVKAELLSIKSNSLKSNILANIPEFDSYGIKPEFKFNTGTILKITQLRDDWSKYFTDQVYSDLELLAPPKENNDFTIYLFSRDDSSIYGEISSSVCDDYDYKLVAKADSEMNVTVTISRNEYDIDLIPRDFFLREKMKKYPYDKDTFEKKEWEKNLTLNQILKGFKDIDKNNIFERIGPFEFTFYYLKRFSNSNDDRRFCYKKFNSNQRKYWLTKFGGIKLFRDNFRVRPYGEVKNSSFDWLELGNRKANSPAGVAKKDGGYRVEPENVAGSIRISRLTNIRFEDKSSREGIQETQEFQVFKRIIANIINIFEEDRSYIARELDAYYNEKYAPEIDRQKAEALANRIRERKRARAFNKDCKENNPHEAELEVMVALNDQKDEEIERLKQEQNILRGLASSGIVMASFAHDLGQLNSTLKYRIDKIKNLLLNKLPESTYQKEEQRKNPYFLLERVKQQDTKTQNWLNFSLGAIRKDKRRMKQIVLRKYFSTFSKEWNSVLSEREISLNVKISEDIVIKAFEVDLDSIFNNLLINSIDAFKILKENRKRYIEISINKIKNAIQFEYTDNGPGLSKDILDPYDIFKPLFTTKLDVNTGEEIGTGLGMWILKSIVTDNNGDLKLIFPQLGGFGIRILIHTT